MTISRLVFSFCAVVLFVSPNLSWGEKKPAKELKTAKKNWKEMSVEERRATFEKRLIKFDSRLTQIESVKDKSLQRLSRRLEKLKSDKSIKNREEKLKRVRDRITTIKNQHKKKAGRIDKNKTKVLASLKKFDEQQKKKKQRAGNKAKTQIKLKARK